MNPKVFALLLSAAVRSCLGGEELARTNYCKLTQEGEPACSIILAEKPGPAARLAALELQFHILKISGALIPIRSENQAVSGCRILVGESSAMRALGYSSRQFKPQEYLVALRPDTILLIGRDWEDSEANRKLQGLSTTGETLQALRHNVDFWRVVGYPERSTGQLELPGLFDDQGTSLAAYDFLERFCGVRWYGPAELNVVIPTRKSLVVSGYDIRRSPALEHRSALPGGNWPFLKGQWGDFTREQVYLYWRRIRQGGTPWAANHTFHRETIKAFFNDPEYQCKNTRGAGSQLCYTNPKLISQVTQMARDYFDGKTQLPGGWKAMGDYFSIVPDDNINLCNCDACRALLSRGLSRGTGFFSSAEMSDYWFTFVNAVARELRKTHPDKRIATLAYWQYAFPPRFDPEPNVSIAPCLHTCYYPVHKPMLENDLLFYRAWQEKAKAPMFLWVYYHHPMELALIEKWYCFPHVMVHETAREMRMFIQDGIRGIFECGEQDQLEQYIIAKVWDEADANVDALINEFFRLYFGSAGEPMKRFYLTLEHIACDPANYPRPYLRSSGIDWKGAAWKSLGTAERMKELGDLIDHAGSLAGTGAEKRRVGLWRKALWDWMCLGREQDAGRDTGNK
jgi:hypothetical protein